MTVSYSATQCLGWKVSDERTRSTVEEVWAPAMTRGSISRAWRRITDATKVINVGITRQDPVGDGCETMSPAIRHFCAVIEHPWEQNVKQRYVVAFAEQLSSPADEVCIGYLHSARTGLVTRSPSLIGVSALTQIVLHMSNLEITQVFYQTIVLVHL